MIYDSSHIWLLCILINSFKGNRFIKPTKNTKIDYTKLVESNYSEVNLLVPSPPPGREQD